MADDRVLIQQVKEANDIVDVVGGYVALRPAGGTFKGLCPFHDDNRPSFDVDPRRQRYRCWSCGKYGDVLTFVQEHERLTFPEALEMLARRAGISLEKKGAAPHDRSRALMLEAVQWAAEQFHQCLLESPLAESARKYVDGRELEDETVRRFQLGYAPLAGDWLVKRAAAFGKSSELLERVGLIARRQEGNGYYDRFRDRVMFPIRSAIGKTVGFGGRVLPSSPLSARGPKYYNSSDTQLFKKSELLYGLDQARQAASKAGYLAVVEGYTDVLMAHQNGVCQVVATMGTALNARHVKNLRSFVGRVVLVFDADAGGDTGVDRALEIFISQDVDLAIATLPVGLDPCDLLIQQGPDAFRAVLSSAVDALDYKLNQVLADQAGLGVEGQRRAVAAVLGVIARAPEMTGQAGAVKRELAVSRIARRLALKEETIWAWLKELRTRQHTDSERRPIRDDRGVAPKQQPVPAPPQEEELLQVLLADPALVATAAARITPEQISHPGIRKLVDGLYRLLAAGETPDFDRLRPLILNPSVAARALEMQDIGLKYSGDRAAWLQGILGRFRERQVLPEKQELQNQLHAASDHAEAVKLLQQLQQQTLSMDSAAPTAAGVGS